jgi:P-type Ca2+ transporter type 2C
MIIILTGAAIVSIVVSMIFPPEGASRATAWIEGFAILMAVVIVTAVTAGNNYSQEKQFQVLNAKQDERPVRVVRGGRKTEVLMTELLVGDIITLEQGDQVPTDGVFVSGHSCSCDESNMTGEAEPQNKNKKKCFMLSGCRVVHGACVMMATAVGMRSEWGKVLSEMDVEREDTPLQGKLGDLARNIGFLGIAVALLVFFILLAYWGIDVYHFLQAPDAVWKWSSVFEIIKFFIISVTIVVVAVPEGLPLAVTIALAYSTQKMMSDNNLVRHLAACETMGGVTQICSDKTGTLTQNRMTVTRGWIAGNTFNGLPSTVDHTVQHLLANSIARNSTGYLKLEEGGRIGYCGNPTECAMLAWINRLPGVDYERLRADGRPIAKMFPFSSARKRMSVVIPLDGSGYRLFCKGASEIILARCSTQLTADGSIVPLNADQKQDLIRVIEEMAGHGLRTLAVAYRDFPVCCTTDLFALGQSSTISQYRPRTPTNPICLSIYLSIYPSIHPSIYPSIHPSVSLSLSLYYLRSINYSRFTNV